jgi:hypothetical protein
MYRTGTTRVAEAPTEPTKITDAPVPIHGLTAIDSSLIIALIRIPIAALPRNRTLVAALSNTSVSARKSNVIILTRLISGVPNSAQTNHPTIPNTPTHGRTLSSVMDSEPEENATTVSQQWPERCSGTALTKPDRTTQPATNARGPTQTQPDTTRNTPTLPRPLRRLHRQTHLPDTQHPMSGNTCSPKRR